MIFFYTYCLSIVGGSLSIKNFIANDNKEPELEVLAWEQGPSHAGHSLFCSISKLSPLCMLCALLSIQKPPLCPSTWQKLDKATLTPPSLHVPNPSTKPQLNDVSEDDRTCFKVVTIRCLLRDPDVLVDVKWKTVPTCKLWLASADTEVTYITFHICLILHFIGLCVLLYRNFCLCGDHPLTNQDVSSRVVGQFLTLSHRGFTQWRWSNWSVLFFSSSFTASSAGSLIWRL